LFWLGIDPIIDRLSTLRSPDKIGHERLAVYRDTIQVIKDFPLLGTGLGTFEDIYPGYETTKSRYIFDQTHNDYLGLLSDTGFLGGLFILGEILAVLIVIVRRWTKRRNTFTTGITLGGITGIIAMLFHGIVDFNMHIPANAMLFFIILALSLAVVEMKTTIKKKRT
jgi:O-antigen ligase